jgi:DNA polymerase-3 subunit gamma/tau
MSQVFYRKYRPQRFCEFLGQEYVAKTVANAVSLGMISHAYLFYGPRGSGKTTLARILAKAINCQKRKEGEAEPCNQCSSCLEIMEGKSMDLVEIDAASHRGIDEIRELRSTIKFAPAKSKYKVFIIDEAHQLTKEAANALLKTLEEPPPHVVFILATTEIHKVIPTILSRCQRFDFKKLSISDIIKKLNFIVEKEKIKIDKKAIELIAQKSDGSLRDAESLLAQVSTLFSEKEIKVEDLRKVLGLVEREIVFEFLRLILDKKAKEAIEYLNLNYEKGMDLQEFAKEVIGSLRDIIVFKLGGEVFLRERRNEEELKKIEMMEKLANKDQLQKMIITLLEAQNRIKYSPLPQLPLELAIVEICSP